MINKQARSESRELRHKRVRTKISGTAERPRLSVFRSNTGIYVQIIDDLAADGYRDIVLLTCKTEATSILSDSVNNGKYRRNVWRSIYCNHYQKIFKERNYIV